MRCAAPLCRIPSPALVPGVPAFVPVPYHITNLPFLIEYVSTEERNAVGAVYLDGDGTVVMYNASIVGSLPALLSMIYGAEIPDTESAYPPGPPRNATLASAVSYMPLTAEESKLSVVMDTVSSQFMGFYIAAGFSSISTVQAVNLVKEREVRWPDCGCAHQSRGVVFLSAVLRSAL